MKVFNCEQGTPEWHALRLARPTASQVDRIITPKTLKPSTSALTYRNQLVAEYLLGYAPDWGDSSQYMERGTALEAEARAFWEMRNDCEIEQVGFILRDDEKFGGSPDGLIGDRATFEAKCPAIHTHIGYLVEPELLEAKYYGQVQASLYLTDRDWCDLLAYSPILPHVHRRVTRDPKYILALDVALNAFIENLDEVKERLAEHRQVPACAAV